VDFGAVAVINLVPCRGVLAVGVGGLVLRFEVAFPFGWLGMIFPPSAIWSDPVCQRLGHYPPCQPIGWLLRLHLSAAMPRPGLFKWSARLMGRCIKFPAPGGFGL
jgi:hypothetical protein